MKKSFVALVLLVCFLSVMGLGKSNLKVWTVYKEEMAAYQALEGMIRSFESETGSKVELVSIPDQTDLDTKLQMAAPLGMGPDVIATMPHDIVGKWANQGLLLNLLEMGEELDPFFESTVQAVTYEGGVYGFPMSVESVALVYNKALVENAPQTWEDVVEIMDRMKLEGKYGLVFPAAEPYHMYGIISGFGGYIFGWKDGQYDIDDIGMNNEGTLKAVDFLKNFFDKGYFPQSMRDRSTQHGFSTGTFEQGLAALQINGPWVIKNLEELGIDYGVAAIPQLPNGEYPGPFLGVQFVGINRYSKNGEDAVELAKYLTSSMNMKEFALKTQLTPTRNDVLETEEIREDDMIKAWATQASLGSPMPNIPEMSSVWSAWSDALQIIYNEKQPAKETLDQLVEAIREKIAIMRK